MHKEQAHRLAPTIRPTSPVVIHLTERRSCRISFRPTGLTRIGIRTASRIHGDISTLLYFFSPTSNDRAASSALRCFALKAI